MICTTENCSTQNANSSLTEKYLSRMQIWLCLFPALESFRWLQDEIQGRVQEGLMIHGLFKPLAHMLLSCLCLLASAILNDFLTIRCVLLPLIPYEVSFLHLEHSFPKFSPTFLNLTYSNSVFRSFLILLPHESLPWPFKSELGLFPHAPRAPACPPIRFITLLCNFLPVCWVSPKL